MTHDGNISRVNESFMVALVMDKITGHVGYIVMAANMNVNS